MGFFQSKSSKDRENQLTINRANVASAEKINQSNIDWQREYYDKTNAYNTPQMQMQRFKEAGLNPHLIYGQGNPGNTSQPSAPVQNVPHQEAYKGSQDWSDWANLGIQGAQAYVGMQQQQAQISNTEAQTQVALAQKENVNAQTASTYMNTAKTSLEKDLASANFETNVKSANAGLASLEANTEKIKQEISASQTGQKLSEAQISKIAQETNEVAQKIKLLQMQGKSEQLKQTLMEYEIELNKTGVQKNDSFIFRTIGNLMGIDGSGIKNMSELYDRLQNGVKNLWQHQR